MSERVPVLLRGLRDVLHSKEAENVAAAVATFFKNLVEAGVRPEDALGMAKGYMIDLRSLLVKKEWVWILIAKRRKGIKG
ncbi:MAG: hypothetical protein NZ651_02635 [Candidatus Bipolaricaulota bacterium]|nr:hypothetical protein [Candidatus Bipolaricaulota bacterium]MDW8126653.1 hypothetical protein [Candidatus Bipolaricaulota bacterium]